MLRSSALPGGARILRAALQLRRFALPSGVFIAVATLSWFLVSTLWAPSGPGVCAATPSAAPDSSSGTRPPTDTLLHSQVAGMGSSGLSLTYASIGLRGVSPKKQDSRPFSPPVHEEHERVTPTQALSLEGHRDSQPANLLDCSFEGDSLRCGECATDGDCPSGEGCVINYEKRTFECAASECEDDSHCFAGFVCRVAAGGAPGPVVRRCLQAGTRLAGESCSRLPVGRDEACMEGLLCINHHCGQPCVPGELESCPEAHVCEESSSGAACLPDCRKLGCTGDAQCAPLNGGAYQCLDLVVDECSDARPCADGADCIVRGGKGGRGGRFCAAACDSWKGDSCTREQVCGVGGPRGSACYAKCDPQDLSTCPNGWLCTTVTEDFQSWGCLPDFLSGGTVLPASRAMRPSAVP